MSHARHHHHLGRNPPRLLLMLLLAGLAGCATPDSQGGRSDLRVAADAASPAPAAIAWATIGHSIHRRPIKAATLGAGPRRIYLVGLIHGDEAEGLAILPDLIHHLGRADLSAAATVRIVRDMNPDGSAAGSRGNARGVDLNRNWPATNFSPSQSRGDRPLSEPETLAVYADLLTFEPELVIVLHSTTRGGPFVNYDGPADLVAERFASAAARLDPDWHTRAEMGYPTPGSLGTYIGVDRRIPILTVEFARGEDGDEAAPVGLLAVIQGAPAGEGIAK